MGVRFEERPPIPITEILMEGSPFAQGEYFEGPSSGHIVLSDVSGTDVSNATMVLDLYISRALAAKGFFLKPSEPGSPNTVCQTELVLDLEIKEDIEQSVETEIRQQNNNPALMQPLSELHEPLQGVIQYGDFPELRIIVDPPDPESGGLYTGYLINHEREERIAFYLDAYNPDDITPFSLVANQLNISADDDQVYVPMRAYADKCLREAAEYCGGKNRVKSYRAKKRWFRIWCDSFKCKRPHDEVQ